MATAADLRRKKPATRVLAVVLDADTAEVIEMKFQAMGRVAWNALIEDHPATPEQQQAFVNEQLAQGVPPSKVERLRWHHDTFPPAAMAACLVDPKVTLEEAHEIWDDNDDWSIDELTKILVACVAVNETSGTAEWGKAFAAIPVSGTSSPQPTTTGSPTANGSHGRKTTKTKRSPTSGT